ncbi:hypothetical protein [uncultured Microbulbifer sp.]|uniref:hypothetical protein n=1 Tax=uncultured Microbulbifer sp. TaxID=348147 RepID=UPI00260E1FF0|nr:hypothetical protein [uncultured Microbulbifer sp.]
MKNHTPDLIALIGLGLLAYGLWKINHSLALCVVGGLLIAFGFLVAWRNARSASMEEFIKARTEKVNNAR